MINYTAYEKEIAIQFAHDLINCGIECYIGCYKNDRQYFIDNLTSLPYDTRVCGGSTRAVFMRDDGKLENWVLKVDYETNSQPYCEREASLYEEALNESVEWAFAATYFLAEIQGIKFYLQERLDCDETCEIESSARLRQYLIDELGVTRDSWEDEDDYEVKLSEWADDLEWDDVFSCLIGDNEVEEFVYQREINDLHQANYGLTKEGSFKIVDYCGYYE